MTTKQKMLQKLASKHSTGGPPVGDEFTITEYQDASGKSNSWANKELARMVRDGFLTTRKGRVGNRQGNIYKPV